MTSNDIAFRRSGRLIVRRATPSMTSYSSSATADMVGTSEPQRPLASCPCGS